MGKMLIEPVSAEGKFDDLHARITGLLQKHLYFWNKMCIRDRSQSTELFISLFPYDYGAFFCTQARLPAFLSAYPEANAFPLTLKNEIIGHRVVIASHKDRVLPQYAQDFISITKEVFAGIATVLPGRPRPFN